MLLPRRPAIKPSPFALPPWTNRSREFRRIGKRLNAKHLARTMDRAVDRLDLRALRQSYAGVGTAPYNPKLLLKVALYEIQLGHHSPAEWHRHAGENNPARWLARGTDPSRSCWYAFRDRLGPILYELNRQVLAQAVVLKLTQGQRASLDGSFVAANASRHKLLKGDALQARLQQLEQACLADTRGDKLATRPAWMAATATGRTRQQRRYQRAVDRCKERQLRQQRQRACDRNKAQPVRLSPSDPDAVLGRDKEKVYRPLYNPQLVRDVDSQLILAYDVFAQASDVGTLEPMFERTRMLLGWLPATWLADSTYATGPHLRAAEQAQVTLYAPWQQQKPGAGAAGKKPPAWLPKESFRWVAAEQAYHCPQGRRLELTVVRTQQRSQEERVWLEEYRCEPAHCLNCPLAAWCTPKPEAGRTVSRSEHEDRFERLRLRMATPQAQELYKKRGQTVELGFADMKGHRKLRRFSGRGLTRVRIEVGLFVLAHNVLLVDKAREAAAASGRAATSEPTRA
jgi:transposase